VRTDFILSGEIIAIALGTVAGTEFPTQVAVLAGVALLMTVGVYGAVAGIVKLDDLGLYLVRTRRGGMAAIGQGLLSAAPVLMRVLTVAGTAAMFLVGGGILTHGVPAAHHLIEDWTQRAAALGSVGEALLPLLANGVAGVVAGALALSVWTLVRRISGR